MAKQVTKKADKVEITVGAKTTEDVVMSPSLRNKVAEIKENADKKEVAEKQKQEEVTIVAPTKNEKLQTQKMVKVMLSKPHRCHIGGEWYSFQANKQYNVPEQVKKTLMNAGLLLPL